MVGPLTSEQIALSFGNSIIIVVVRARRMTIKIEVLCFDMVGPLTSEQIALSFGNSIIIAGVRARTVTLPSLFNNTQVVIIGLKITLNLL